MGDHVRSLTPSAENSQYVTRLYTGRAIPPWVGAMSTNQRMVMLCTCGIKAGIVRVWVAGKAV